MDQVGRGEPLLQVFGGGPWPSDVHQRQRRAIAQVGIGRWEEWSKRKREKVGGQKETESLQKQQQVTVGASDQRRIGPDR